MAMRGQVKTRPGSKRDAIQSKKSDNRKRDVFFQLLQMARLANRKALPHWALVGNISAMARGVGRSAETAFAFFGNTVTGMTRVRLFGKITGNNKAGKASRNTMAHKLMRLFRSEQALVLCYDNFQRGLTLQHQRGKHSSAFFNGTHQCAHKVVPFNNTTFDLFFPEFTQLNQDIPSPWGMPAFETINKSSLGTFFASYDTFESIVLPDFTGVRVRAYNDIKDMAVHLKHLC